MLILSRLQRHWQLNVAILVLDGVIAAIVSVENPALAQITPDTTLGSKNSTVKSVGLLDQISGGATKGTNLFHSFREFSVPTGGSAFFNNAPDIQNIISRVTGLSVSNIDGLLKANGNANLFLMNPNGIIFGENASLDVKGSFVATTADAIGFDNQTFFSASAPNVPPVLTVNPSAFLFNQIAAQPITVNSGRRTGLDKFSRPLYVGGLKVPDGQSLLLVGGDVTLDGGQLNALGGRVELGGLAGSATVNLNINGSSLHLRFPEDVVRADVLLRDGSEVRVLADDGGSIAINAQNLDVLGASNLRAGIGEGLGSANSKAGDIEINVTEATTFDGKYSPLNSNGAFNRVDQGAVGDSGNIDIITGSLLITNNARLSTRIDGTGNAGNLNITTNSLFATNGGFLLARTFGTGNAGKITIQARDQVSFEGVGRGRRSGAYIGVEKGGGDGNGGSMNITAGSLFVTNGARVFASTGGEGDAGNIEITTGVFKVTNGAQVGAGTSGPGDAGRITIQASDQVSFDGVDSGAFSSVGKIAEGDAGGVSITTGSLAVTNGGFLRASSEGNGPAGNIEVKAGSIRLDNQALLSSDTTGGEGNIKLRSEDLVLRRGSNITTNATGTATGGNITINTGVLAALEDSNITANAIKGKGGGVIINTQGIFRSPDSDITASSDRGPEFSGIVEINTPDVDPTRGLTELPDAPVNVEVAQGCQAGGKQASVEFFNTGKGGLPPNPYEPLSSSEIWEDLSLPTQATATPSATPRASTNSPTTLPNQIIEAKGWLINEKGEVTLLAKVPHAQSQQGCRLR